MSLSSLSGLGASINTTKNAPKVGKKRKSSPESGGPEKPDPSPQNKKAENHKKRNNGGKGT